MNQRTIKLKKYLTALLLSTATLPAHADIISVSGGMTQIATPFGATITGNWMNGIVIFAERQNVTLLNPLALDIGGTLAAGSVVDSYFVTWGNTSAADNLVADTSVTFDGSVLGLVALDFTPTGVSSPNFALTNFLGAPGITYQTGCLYCAFEIFDGTNQGSNFDTAMFAAGRVDFHNLYSVPGDFARILVAQPLPTPGPIVGAGIPGLALGLLGMLGWRRRARRQ
jgi:hypothetical protein